MRLAFMGTPEFSVPFLQILHQAGHEIAAVYTRAPQAGGRRGLKKVPSPVHQAAYSLGLRVFTPKTLRDREEQARFAALNLDAAIIVAYGLLLPRPVLDAPRLGCYNAHASLLPRWRGAAPIQRAIEAGDADTGIVIMRMDKGLDTGPILWEGAAGTSTAKPFIYKLPIDADMTAGAVFTALAESGAKLMARAVAALSEGNFHLVAQAEKGACYAHKIEKGETRIDWGRAAFMVHKHICALSPFPGAWCEMEMNGKRERIKILASHLPTMAELEEAQQKGLLVVNPQGVNPLSTPSKARYLAVFCGDQENKVKQPVFLTKLQKMGGKPLAVYDFLHGSIPTAVF